MADTKKYLSQDGVKKLIQLINTTWWNKKITDNITTSVDGGIDLKRENGTLTINAINKGTVTSITAGDGLTGGTITSTGTIALDTTGVTANTYGEHNLPDNNGSLSFGGTFKVPAYEVDKFGRIVSSKTVTYGLPAVSTLGLTGDDYISVTDNKISHKTIDGLDSSTTYGPNQNATPGHGGGFSVPYFEVDAAGHIVKAGSSTVTLPSTGDDKKTASSNDTTNKLFLIGAQSQSADGVDTYSNENVYISGNALYISDGENGESKVATEKFVSKALSNAGVSAFNYKGEVKGGAEGSAYTMPETHTTGDVYYVKTEGYINAGSDAEFCEVGDMIICKTTGSTANSSDWNVVQGNWTAKSGSENLSWDTSVILATIGGVDVKAKLPAQPQITGTANGVAYYGGNGAIASTAAGTKGQYLTFDDNNTPVLVDPINVGDGITQNETKLTTAAAVYNFVDGIRSTAETANSVAAAAKSAIEAHDDVIASDSALGHIKLGYSATEGSKNYAVEVDNEGKAFVNVPWETVETAALTDEEIQAAFDAAIPPTQTA